MIRGLLNTPEEMRGWLDGKSQFRVPVKPQPEQGFREPEMNPATGDWSWWRITGGHNDWHDTCAPYSPGDLAYCREAWRPWSFHDGEPVTVEFKAGGPRHECYTSDPARIDEWAAWEERISETVTRECMDAGLELNECDEYSWDAGESPLRWRPSINMPQWASRHWLRILTVRAERVQAISYDDAEAEGVNGGCTTCGNPEPCDCEDPSPDHRDSFIYSWNERHASKGFGWDTNCWLWRYTTEEAEKP